MPAPKPTPPTPMLPVLFGMPPAVYLTGAALILAIASAISFYFGLKWR